MNRKWKLILLLSALLPTVFVSGVVASPTILTTACQTSFKYICVFVVNFPSNQNTTATNPSSTVKTIFSGNLTVVQNSQYPGSVVGTTFISSLNTSQYRIMSTDIIVNSLMLSPNCNSIQYYLVGYFSFLKNEVSPTPNGTVQGLGGFATTILATGDYGNNQITITGPNIDFYLAVNNCPSGWMSFTLMVYLQE